jgi:hypothetical protein
MRRCGGLDPSRKVAFAIIPLAAVAVAHRQKPTLLNLVTCQQLGRRFGLLI